MNQEDILVVGSVALDSVYTEHGKALEALGGSATYFSLASRLFAPTRLVGVVGEDFPAEHRKLLLSHQVGIEGLEIVKGGKTFRWTGKYTNDFRDRESLQTDLNVFEEFKPRLTDAMKDAPYVLLANIDPDLQLDVLNQMNKPKIVGCDTMDLWIKTKRPELRELFKKVNVLFINEDEARLFTKKWNLVAAARVLAESGPEVVVIKKGEYGSMFYSGGKYFNLGAVPVENVVDPTGAGDTFAGGFLGSLTQEKDPWSLDAMKRAMIHGTVLASFTVQEFSTGKLAAMDRATLDAAVQDFLDAMRLPETAASVV